MLFQPSDVLKPYVKGYILITVDRDLINEVFYPSGYIELAVNIYGAGATTIINGRPIAMPKLEVIGQVTVPTRLTVSKGTKVLIARIYPFAGALFLPNPVSDYTNDSLDLFDVTSNGSNEFYYDLLEAGSIEQKVKVFDKFLVKKLKENEKTQKKITLIEQICNYISAQGDSFDIKKLSDKYGFTERYIQKLFTSNVGLPPHSFYTIQRFNKSLELVHRMDLSLTSIAYDCGYYDQAHFIREFKKFTGLTPSEARSLHAVS